MVYFFTGPFGNHGCVKGSVTNTLDYMIDQGINAERVYPYVGVQKKCHFDSRNSKSTIRGYQKIKRGSEAVLKNAVALEGPVIAGIDASHNNFRVS